MKFRWDKKYLYGGLTAFIVFICCIGVIYLLFNGTILKSQISNLISICMPIIDGIVIAYLLSPIVNTLEKKVIFPLYKKLNVINDKKTFGKTRVISIAITLIIAFTAIYSFILYVIPQIYTSIQSIIGQFPYYYKNLMSALDNILMDLPEIENYLIEVFDKIFNKLSTFNQDILTYANNLIRTLSLSIISIVKEMSNLLIGIIVSVYLLYNKERFLAQGKKVIYAFLEREHANNLISDCEMINKTFSGFIIGKILDSIIIGILCFICISFIGTPYPALISLIVGVTNVIPFFGPYLGAIPSAILVLMVDPIQCIYFIIFILILQQFDGNILGPRILGNTIGLPSGFWIIFSVTIFGGLFGLVGMIIGVPVFAVGYTLLNRKVKKNLKKKGLSDATDDYKELIKVDENNQFVHKVIERTIIRNDDNKDNA